MNSSRANELLSVSGIHQRDHTEKSRFEKCDPNYLSQSKYVTVNFILRVQSLFGE